MAKFNILILYCILNLVLLASHTEKCGEEQIENCGKCGTGDSANTCLQCKDKYFPVINNLYCLACDDPLYGQIGCGGSCDASNILNDRLVMCGENECKEEFYNLNGICFKCSEGLYACKKCSINYNFNGEKEIKCDECLNDEYILNEYGQCTQCQMEHCLKCHFSKDSEEYKEECDECEGGFYVDSNKKCKICNNDYSIPNGYCTGCKDNPEDYESGPCWCYSYYTLQGLSTCVECPENCYNCGYNNQTNKIECIECAPGYILNSEKICVSCGEGCEYCYLSKNSEPACLQCFTGALFSNNKCKLCPENCEVCEYDYNNEIKCTKCNYRYTLLNNGTCKECPLDCNSCIASENGQIECLNCDYNYVLNSEKGCDYCLNYEQEGMKGCERCGYNENITKYICYECEKKQREDSYEWYNIYAYVTNTFQCFNNSDPDKPYFYGCLKSYFNESSNKYECQICNDYKNYNPLDFIMVANEKICKQPYEINLWNCYEAENIGTEENPIYSCTKCYENTAKIIDKDKRINCYSRYEENLQFCLEGEIDDNNMVKCTKCVSNSQLNSGNICECNPDSFGKYYELCYKCDDINYGIPGCNAEKGCSNYYYSNDQLNCNECKDGYFNFTQGQCFSCSLEINNCEKCHYDDSKNKLICDKCPDGYSYNSDEKKCEVKNCKDYPEICEGCIICEGKLEEYISNKKCQKCKVGYFQTKEGQCVPCRTEENGGPACFKCKYSLIFFIWDKFLNYVSFCF